MAVTTDFVDTVKQIIFEELPGGRHSFSRKVFDGRATRADLAVYAVQTYHRNLYSSRFATANHSHCPIAEIRRGLLEVAIEEELKDAGERPSHAELMLRFAVALGMRREDVEGSRPLPSTLTFIDTIMNLSQGHWLEGIAFRASELRAPEGSSRWLDVLQRVYGFPPEACEWWRTHAEVDVEHGNISVNAYTHYVRDESEKEIAIRALRRMNAAWWVLLDGVERAGEAALRGEDVGFPLPAAAR